MASLTDVSYAYPNGSDALRSLTFDIPTGHVVSVVGPSGCGKSTLLALLAGLREPTGGSIWWDESLSSGDTQSRHQLSMLFQQDTLLPWLTVEGNVDLHFKLTRSAGISREDRHRRNMELIKLAGLDGFEGLYPYQLSGGMRRRTAFLSSVAPFPRVLLLDEPFSALDEPTRIGLHQDVFDIVRRYAITVILVTHDIAEAISLSDEIVLLSKGPAVVRSIRRVPFGNERQMLDLRKMPEFLELYGELWDELSNEIKLR
jgi:NitT/TauT family transport system ATP-binding protein